MKRILISGLVSAKGKTKLVCLLAYTTTESPKQDIKCHFCASQDYLPAWAETKLMYTKDFNTSYSHSDMDLDFLAKDCSSSKHFCHNGTFCAKRTVTYDVKTEDNSSLTYTSFLKLCTSFRLDGSGTNPQSGECLVEVSHTNRSTLAGVSRNSSWCYCNDKDYCNAYSIIKINNVLISLIILMFFFFN
uniref:Uncharacterized protein n=1 Tax=Ditylenchus dipsaci TaxID=166011 RepID=A0A915ERS3_9BILA